MVLWFERISKYCASMLYWYFKPTLRVIFVCAYFPQLFQMAFRDIKCFIFHGELYRIVADRLQLLLEDTLYQLSHLLDGLKINLSNWLHAFSQQVAHGTGTNSTYFHTTSNNQPVIASSATLLSLIKRRRTCKILQMATNLKSHNSLPSWVTIQSKPALQPCPASAAIICGKQPSPPPRHNLLSLLELCQAQASFKSPSHIWPTGKVSSCITSLYRASALHSVAYLRNSSWPSLQSFYNPAEWAKHLFSCLVPPGKLPLATYYYAQCSIPLKPNSTLPSIYQHRQEASMFLLSRYNSQESHLRLARPSCCQSL